MDELASLRLGGPCDTMGLEKGGYPRQQWKRGGRSMSRQANLHKEVLMKPFGELFQSADWKKEKHVPVIECPDEVAAGENVAVTLSIGKEIGHPNTTEHHIRWIALYFQGEGDKFPFQLGHFEFTAHGESTAGPNQGPAYTHHQVTTWIKLDRPGTLYAASFCNIHGFWWSSHPIQVA